MRLYHRPWSMRQNKGIYDILRSPATPRNCSVEEIISNIAMERSVSIQKQCISWKTTNNICKSVGNYAVVLFNGDTFTRHLLQGMMMVWTADLRFGAYPRIPEMSATSFNHCGCDGQFSLSSVCNKFNKVHLSFHDARTRGLCSGLVNFDEFDFIFTEAHPDEHEQYQTMNLTSSLQHLCSADQRLRFIYLQTGLHRYNNASNMINVFLQPRLKMIQRVADECKYYINDLLRIVFIDETSPFSIEDYHSEKNDFVVKFNKGGMPALHSRTKLDAHHKSMVSLMSAYPHVYLVNFRAFIAESNISSSYDGLYSLADVNALKALYILHFMDKLFEDYKIKNKKDQKNEGQEERKHVDVGSKMKVREGSYTPTKKSSRLGSKLEIVNRNGQSSEETK